MPDGARSWGSFSPATRLTGSTLLCSGYSACSSAGYSDAGYGAASGRMYWQMYSGVNCTNYAAYRLIRNGMSSSRPWSGSGMAYNWGRAMGQRTDATPTVGSIAWWESNRPGIGSGGHVAYVEKVTATEIVVSESNWGRSFDWRRISRTSNTWPSGFIHFKDVAQKPLVNTARPALNGTAKIGHFLTASAGRWNQPGVKLSYRWYDNGVPFKVTTAKFRPMRARLGRRLSVKVTASKSGFSSASVMTPATQPIAPGDLANRRAPRISGSMAVGQTLTLDPGSYTPGAEAKAVQWYADGRPVAGATGASFVVNQAHAGATVTAAVTARRRGFNDLAVRSAPVGPAGDPAVGVRGGGTVSGAAVVGQTLTATPVVTTPADATAVYSWLRNGQPVAQGRSYRVRKTDVGASLALRVIVQSAGHRSTEVRREAGVVRSKPWFRVRAVGRKHGAVVRIWVASPGVLPTPGSVSAQVGGRTLTARLVDGKAVLRFAGLRPGAQRVVVNHPGGGVLLPASTSTTVRVAS